VTEDFLVECDCCGWIVLSTAPCKCTLEEACEECGATEEGGYDGVIDCSNCDLSGCLVCISLEEAESFCGECSSCGECCSCKQDLDKERLAFLEWAEKTHPAYLNNLKGAYERVKEASQ